MSQTSYFNCLESINNDDYASFKENYEMGVNAEESEYLLRAAIMNHKKFIVEYLIKSMELTEDQIYGGQILSSSNQSLDIFNLFIEGKQEIVTQAWVNIFNLHNFEIISELLEKKELPSENQLVIIQYALANGDKKVHELAFDKLFKPELLESPEITNDMINCICFSGNLDLLDRIDDTKDVKAFVRTAQEKHLHFSNQLDEYIELIFQNTPKEKVASTVNYLNLMEEIRANPQVEDWDIIIQDYLVHEETSFISKIDAEVSETCKKMNEIICEAKLNLLEISEVSPSNYLIQAKNILDGSELNLALDRRIYDVGSLYVCYTVKIDGQDYISSHPMFVLANKKNLIQLALRKEKDKKQQKANKKSKSKKKSSAKVNLSSAETLKILLNEHIRSRKELDDSV